MTQTHRIVGGGIVGTHAGDMIGEIALAIEMGADAVDIGTHDPPAPDAGRIDRHGRRSGARQCAPTCRRSASVRRTEAMRAAASRGAARARLSAAAWPRC